MSLLSPPSLAEAYLYLRHNGLQRSLTKFLAGYIAGRQSWHVTLEEIRHAAPAADVIPRPNGVAPKLPRTAATEDCAAAASAPLMIHFV